MIMLSNRNGMTVMIISGFEGGLGYRRQLLSDPGNNPPFTGEYDPEVILPCIMTERDPVAHDASLYRSAQVQTVEISNSSITFGQVRQAIPSCRVADKMQQGVSVLMVLGLWSDPDMTASFGQAILDGSYEVTDTLYVNNATNIGWGPLGDTWYQHVIVILAQSCSTPVCQMASHPNNWVEPNNLPQNKWFITQLTTDLQELWPIIPTRTYSFKMDGQSIL